ncbi:MAG: hypothetical protein KatS3mg033_0856 [Thermonema sp.]|uniref:mechanosensitive ion channel family protein n=1 Tax=Thermonema sp. TaxID=2231181 RepID=UPI0021DDF8B7|nr:mechanosensitive ion channel domain-containing protein [Thermonema sp.]GIV39056.1 MAG: hypothetical protein KatS3mg033_0856 [Thermonema sp.]
MKEYIVSWNQVIMESLSGLLHQIAASIPFVIGALLTLLIGWLIAKLLAFVTYKFLNAVKFDALFAKDGAQRFLKAAGWQGSPAKLTSRIVYWIVILLTAIAATDIIGWKAVSQELARLIGYLPKFLSAVIIFILGSYIIRAVRDFLRGTTAGLGIGAGRLVSGFVYYFLYALLVLTVLQQAGVDTQLINTNLTLIIGAILLAFTISYGFASRDLLANILASFYGRRLYKEGDRIRIGTQEGEIEEIKNVAVVIRTQEGKRIVIPTHRLLQEEVEILPSDTSR